MSWSGLVAGILFFHVESSKRGLNSGSRLILCQRTGLRVGSSNPHSVAGFLCKALDSAVVWAELYDVVFVSIQKAKCVKSYFKFWTHAYETIAPVSEILPHASKCIVPCGGVFGHVMPMKSNCKQLFIFLRFHGTQSPLMNLITH